MNAALLTIGARASARRVGSRRTWVLRREHNRSRLEIRFLECQEVEPAQVGFPRARLAARLETRTKRKGKWQREVVYLLSSLTLAQLQAEGLLALKRGYWVVESRLHHCLLRPECGLADARVYPYCRTLNDPRER